jgi:hypothetical protein
MHFVVNKSRRSSSTVRNLISSLKKPPIGPDTWVRGRGNVTRTHVEWIVSSAWKLICGVPTTSKKAKELQRGALFD